MSAQRHIELVASSDVKLDEPITPELALVDPDLAQRARELLELPRPPRRAVPGRAAIRSVPQPPEPTFDTPPAERSQPAEGVTPRVIESKRVLEPLSPPVALPEPAPVALPEASPVPVPSATPVASPAKSVRPDRTARQSSAAPPSLPLTSPSPPARLKRRRWLSLLCGMTIPAALFAAGLVGGLVVADVWAPERPTIFGLGPEPGLNEPSASPAAPTAANEQSNQTQPRRDAPDSGVGKRPADDAIGNPAFVWVAAPNAARYEVIFERDGKTVYRATTSLTRLELPRSWRYAGKTYRLERGRYHWTVWPLVNGKRGRAVVSSDYEL